MAAITYGSQADVQGTTADKTSIPQTVTKPSFLSRLWTAMIEARMRQAMTELRLHQHMLPGEFEIAGNRITYKNEDQLPFVQKRD